MAINYTRLICPLAKVELFPTQKGLEDNDGKVVYPKVNGAFRIANDNNYTRNFGFQWNKFEKTQIDRDTCDSIQSFQRFFGVTKWNQEDLRDKKILEVGCGAGRFTNVILENTLAELHSIDYSNSVEACFKNNMNYSNRLFLYQASIYELPFGEDSFDKVFCFGVLQHTPDVEKSVESLIKMVKPGGELIVDFYPIKGWYTKIHAKYILRPFLKRLSDDALLNLIEQNIDWMINLTSFFSRIRLGRFINRFIPVCDIANTFPENLTKAQIREWAILDTFDMFSPTYDSPQKIKKIVSIFRNNNMAITFNGYINYEKIGNVAVVKGIKE